MSHLARPRARRAVLVASLLLVLFAGCDSGDEDGPGTTNLLPPPRLRIVQPRPDAEIPVWDARRRLGKMKVLFGLGGHRLAPPGESGLALYMTLEDQSGPGESVPTRIYDIRKAVVRKPVIGTATLRAWLTHDGRVLHDSGSYAVRRVFVGRDPEAEPPKPLGPVLIWAGPHRPQLPAPPEDVAGPGVHLDVLVAGATLEEGRSGLRFEWGGTPTDRFTSGAVEKLFPSPGRYPVRVTLIERRGDAWVAVPRASIVRDVVVEERD